MTKLLHKDLEFVVSHYMGTEVFEYNRQLGDQHRLREFYLVDCELDILPTSPHSRKIMERFIEVLVSQPPQNQSKILRAVRGRIPPGDMYTTPEHRGKMITMITALIERLESETTMIEPVSPKSSKQVVLEALIDAEEHISKGRVPSAVDRIHNALHGYLKEMCDDESIDYEDDANLPQLFKVLQKMHTAFQGSGTHQEKIDNIGKGLSTAIHSLNEIRNKASSAHPNEDLLDVCDATLAINAMRTIFHYVEEKRSPRGGNLLRRIFSRT